MKIDFVAIGYYPIIGGTETLVKNLAERMALKGHNVTVHASKYNPNYNGKLIRREVINGVNVIRYKLLPFYVFLPKIRNSEIIHLFSYGDNFVVQTLLHHSSKFVSSPIGEELYSKHKLRNRLIGSRILNYSNVIFALTTYEKIQLNRIYGISLNKIVVCPLGVKAEDLLSPDTSNVRESILQVICERYFIRLARLDRLKRLEFGIQLLPRLRDIKYIVVGPTDDMSYLKELQELSKRLNVEDRVIFTGRVNEDEKRLLLRKSRFYLIANHETFGGATIEAMAQGTPIVAPNVEEYRDIVIDHFNSLVYEYDSIEDCTKKVEMLNEDDGLRQKLGANGIQMAKENFNWDRIADAAERIYMSL